MFSQRKKTKFKSAKWAIILGLFGVFTNCEIVMSNSDQSIEEGSARQLSTDKAVKIKACEEDVNPWRSRIGSLSYFQVSSANFLEYAGLRDTPPSTDFPYDYTNKMSYEQLPLAVCVLDYKNEIVIDMGNLIVNKASALELVNPDNISNRYPLFTCDNVMGVFVAWYLVNLITYQFGFTINTCSVQTITAVMSMVLVALGNEWLKYLNGVPFYDHSLMVEYTTPIFWKVWEIKREQYMPKGRVLKACAVGIEAIESCIDRRNYITKTIEKLNNKYLGSDIVRSCLPVRKNTTTDFESMLRINMFRLLGSLDHIPEEKKDEFLSECQNRFKQIAQCDSLCEYDRKVLGIMTNAEQLYTR